MRKKYSSESKAKVALEAVKGSQTLSELSEEIWSTSKYDSEMEEPVVGSGSPDIFRQAP